ncbi:hypothetical protein CPLU01_01820 [Colletotrichum plurivorum]|uniref:Uncharacterized protein n=1 Tax=Colletotrichum plurivorum TaxID=2175906 RepID=A0A8H6KY15_9PEZI|nr:hypothetical protein CPLU01_01820 [Colletotrichum plurivorum]
MPIRSCPREAFTNSGQLATCNCNCNFDFDCNFNCTSASPDSCSTSGQDDYDTGGTVVSSPSVLPISPKSHQSHQPAWPICIVDSPGAPAPAIALRSTSSTDHCLPTIQPILAFWVRLAASSVPLVSPALDPVSISAASPHRIN